MDAFLRELYARNNAELTEIFLQSRVGIAGCGGLGSNVAVMLVRAGVGHLVLVDHDLVELSNLNRQHYFIEDLGRPKVEALADVLRRINRTVVLDLYRFRLTEESLADVFASCQVVAEAFHLVEEKAMILRAFSSPPLNEKFLVCASGIAGIASSNNIRTHKLAKNIFICGDLQTEPDAHRGLMAPRVTLAAAHQANMILRILAGEPYP